MQLRPVTPDDADDVAETSRQGFESYREWAPATYDPPPAGLESGRIREGLQRPDTWGLIALDESEVAGHVLLAQARQRAEPRPEIPGLAHLWMLFVRRRWWGSGLAAELNRRVVEEGTSRGYARMRLFTPAGQARARAFYEREGWQTDGVSVPEPLLGLDLVEYRREL